MEKVNSRGEKERLSKASGMLLLCGIMLLAVFAHINFFMHDGRPFLDHDWYYVENESLKPLAFLYNIFIAFMGVFFKCFEYDGFFAYKFMQVFFLLPLAVFVYMTAGFLYGRLYGLLATFMVVTTPDIINVFHKSGINFLTASMFSAVVYFYVRSNWFRHLPYSFLCLVSLYLFFLHHYGSLLYMSAMLPVLFVFYLFRIRKNKRMQTKIILSLLLITGGVISLWCFDSERCRYYLDAAFVYIKDTGGLKNFLGMEFISAIIENVFYLYNKFGVVGLSRFKVNPYLLLFGFSCLLLTLDTVYAVAKKTEGKRIFNLENQFVLIIFLYLFISAGSGLFSYRDMHTVSIFFAPLYILVAIVISGVLFRCSEKYSESRVMKIIYGVLFLCIFLYGFFSLFYSGVLVDNQDPDVDCYVVCEDNYNIPAHLEFFREENLDVRKIVFAAAFDDYNSEITSFYFWVRNKNRLDKGLFLPKDNPAYVWVLSLYDPEDKYSEELTFKRFYAPADRNASSLNLSFFSVKPFWNMLEYTLTPLSVSLPALEKATSVKASKEVLGEKIQLIKILPFGLKTEKVYRLKGLGKLNSLYQNSFKGCDADLAVSRQYLIFVYKVVSS